MAHIATHSALADAEGGGRCYCVLRQAILLS